MSLYFRNSTNASVYVAYAYQDSSCRPVTYTKIGWYRVDPGQTRLVWNGYVGGRTFFYYAEDAFRRQWSGSYFTQLPNQAFQWCWNTGCTTCRNLGFSRIDISVIYANFTINLTTSSSQGVAKSGNIHTALPTKSIKGKPVLRRTPKVMPSNLEKGKPILVNRIILPGKRK
ncbi:DUF1036 domain-containing protein [Paenibacillus sp. IHBB 10380]|uniref:DUF1036 domain-containing protein n=1 Tax=Paenibacillus sp. IHBB 10380 TaxID=1566358 RepID=UPI0005D90F89|nr:DUF1036 domain-containing protein [Paenibacillus sp. IHBB 10380]AJS60623.1 hypothetical protein UB51_21610 [Paenibacillus sp. IHBB 10380]